MQQAFDPIEQAMIETDREIAAEAWDQESVPLDPDNDRTPESQGDGLEGQHLDEDEVTDEVGEIEAEGGEGAEEPEKPNEGEAEPKPEAKTELKAETPEKPNGKVPSGVHRQVTERARAAEAERDALKAQIEAERTNSRKELDALNAKFDGLLAAIRQQQPAKPNGEVAPEPVIPDQFEDPKGYTEFIQKGFQAELSKRDQQLSDLRVNMSLQMAHAIHKDVFVKAIAEAKSVFTQNPSAEDNATANRIYSSDNPGEALVTWYKRREALREVGDDPAAYRQRIADETRKALVADPEFRKTLIAELRGEAATGANGKPNTITRLPKSLAAAGGSARVGTAADEFDGSEQAIAESAWR